MIALLLAAALIRPDAKLTPGATVNVPLATLCKPGYTKTVRHTSGRLKAQVYREYGVTSHKSREWEIDHLIPLELGGADVLGNLWAQPGSGQWNYHLKDNLEKRLATLVCSGKLDLKSAQDEIRTDWIASYQKRFGK